MPGPSTKPNQLAADPRYLRLAGVFQTSWGADELAVDCAIGKLLRIDHYQTHLITGGLQLGPKLLLLRNLAKHTPPKHHEKLNAALKVLDSESKRNVFAHAYMWSDKDKVAYIERKKPGEDTKLHVLTISTLNEHIKKFVQASMDVSSSLDISEEELQAFLRAAIKVSNRPKTSPHPPE